MATPTALATGIDVILQGDATERDGIVILTSIEENSNPKPHSVGRVLYSKPVQLWESGKQARFETTIKFKIDSKGNDPLGNGIAFFIEPVGTEILRGSLAVEFVTYDPWGPNSPYIGININSKSVVRTPFVDFLGKEVTATITYSDGTITVVANTLTKPLTYNVNLSDILPEQVQIRVSGYTGDNVEYNYLYYWSFTYVLIGHN